MENMIDHHEMAVQMGQACLQNAVHPELQSLCQNVVTSQSQQIQEMQTWLQDWYGITYQPQMTQGDENKVGKLNSLSGVQFEISFMQGMIKHHARAVREGQQCEQRAYHSELQSLCQNIVSSQSAQIQQMQTWLCQWYGICENVNGKGK